MRWYKLGVGALVLVLLIVLAGVFVSFLNWGSFAPEPGLVQLTHYRGQSTEPAWSPDGRYVVFASRHENVDPEQPLGWHEDELYTIDIGSGDVKRITHSPRNEGEPAWSPDGETIAFAGSGARLCLMRAGGSHVYCLPVENATRLAWSPDSESLAYDDGHEIYLLPVDEGVPMPPAEPLHRGRAPVWSPDGRCLAFSSDGLYVTNADGSNLTLLPVEGGTARPFGWSPDGRFIFVTLYPESGKASQLYAVSASGGNEIRLTSHSEGHASPALSPDGARIAFHSLRDEGYNIYLMDVRGVPPADTNAACLDRRLGHPDRHPAWSPDGTKIAFISERDGSPELYLFDLNHNDDSGRAVFRLLPQVTVDPESRPSWSPDGTQLTFAASHDGDGSLDIYTVQVGEGSTGLGLVRLTDGPAQDAMPVWSPDGMRLAFRSDLDGAFDVYALDLETRAVLRLTQDGANNSPYGWSPDGARIVFTATRGDNLDVYTMRSDGSDVQRLTKSRAADDAPAWSPDGQQIMFVSDRDGNAELYVMDADGGHETRVTHNATQDTSPTWAPDGKRFAFVSLYGVCTQSAPKE
jgi:Tol biopolymer transport system component